MKKLNKESVKRFAKNFFLAFAVAFTVIVAIFIIAVIAGSIATIVSFFPLTSLCLSLFIASTWYAIINQNSL